MVANIATYEDAVTAYKFAPFGSDLEREADKLMRQLKPASLHPKPRSEPTCPKTDGSDCS